MTMDLVKPYRGSGLCHVSLDEEGEESRGGTEGRELVG